MNQACIVCDKRWSEGIHPHVNISMCQKCLDDHKPRGKKTKDYTETRTAVDHVYERMRGKATPKREKSILEYLRSKK